MEPATGIVLVIAIGFMLLMAYGMAKDPANLRRARESERYMNIRNYNNEYRQAEDRYNCGLGPPPNKKNYY